MFIGIPIFWRLILYDCACMWSLQQGLKVLALSSLVRILFAWQAQNRCSTRCDMFACYVEACPCRISRISMLPQGEQSDVRITSLWAVWLTHGSSWCIQDHTCQQHRWYIWTAFVAVQEPEGSRIGRACSGSFKDCMDTLSCRARICQLPRLK